MKVAIIGAGVCGLTAIKCCLDEGLQPVCFEKGTDLGGIWRYDSSEKNHNCVYNDCVMVTSKEMSSFSDFPVPKDYPLYLPHKSVLNYLNSYADHFKLRSYIRYNTTVEKIRETQEESAKWCLIYNENSIQNVEKFDAVLICSGHHRKPVLPKLEGQDIFQGRILHSSSFREAKEYQNKNVLVVGIGDSGTSIACQLSDGSGGRRYLSTRRGAWVTSRLQLSGIPADQTIQRRAFFDLVPRNILDWFCMKLANLRFDHGDFGLLPNHSFLQQRPVMNDDLPYKLSSGRLSIKPDVMKLTERDVHFRDGSMVRDIDVIILATGYQHHYPFLDDDINNQPALYKHIFRVEPHPTIAFIGCLDPVGCMFPVAELQCRLATQVFKDLIKLPNVMKMRNEIEERKKKLQNEYYDAKKFSKSVYLIPYCDDLASLISCKPNFKKLFLTDPYLAYRCYFGPCSPSQYRLTGPGTWKGARKVIMELPERNVHQMKKVTIKQNISYSQWQTLIIGLLAIFAIVFHVHSSSMQFR